MLIVSVSGCTNFSTGNSTYKYGSISFLIPSDFQNATKGNDIVSGDKNWQTIAYMANSDVTLVFQKYNGNMTPNQVIRATELEINQNNGNVTSTTNTTNPNGVQIYGSINTLVDPKTGKIITYHDMSFKTKGITYYLSVYGSKDQENMNVYSMVYNSLRV